MHAENWMEYPTELERWPVTVTCYRISSSYVTQVESSPSGKVIARSIAASRDESEKQAFETAKRRLLHTRYIELTVGG